VGIVAQPKGEPHLAYCLDDRLFWRNAEGQLQETKLGAEPVLAAIGPTGLALASESVVHRFETNGTAIDVFDLTELEGVQVLPGHGVSLLVAAPAHRLLCGDPAREIVIPEGATRAKFAAPFASGVGMCWIDLDQLYRWTEGRAPAALCRAGKATGMAVGPEGAVVVQVEDAVILAAPRSPSVRISSEIDTSSVRFSADGKQALAADEDGAVWFDLEAGTELKRWDGEFLPLGFAPGPYLLNGTSGAVVNAKGKVFVRLCPAG
jgi:hypothetical protein